MKSKSYRWCAVPQCTSTTIKTPNKLFVFVPYKKTIRNKWLKFARRDLTGILPTTQLYFCEDHFDLPNDMENYMEYHVMGSVSQIRMKPGCIPLKYTCQHNRRKRKYYTTERQYVLKEQGMIIIEECLKEDEEYVDSKRLVGVGETSCSVLQDNISQDAEKTVNKCIQGLTTKKFGSKAIQTKISFVNQIAFLSNH